MKIKVERCRQGAANFAGLMSVVELVKKSGLDKVVRKHPCKACKVGIRINDLNVLLSYCCLLAQSKSDYEHVREFKIAESHASKDEDGYLRFYVHGMQDCKAIKRVSCV